MANEQEVKQEQSERKKISAEEFIKIWEAKYSIPERYPEHFKYLPLQGKVVTFENVEITEDIVVKSTNLLPIFLSNVSIGNISIRNCAVGDIAIHSNSDIGIISIAGRSNCRNISLKKSTTKNIYVEDSKVQDIIINESTTENFGISDHSNVEDIFIQNNSTIRNFSIENSITENFGIGNSVTGNFEIRKSTTGDFKIEKSTTGYFWIHEDSAIKFFLVSENSALGAIHITNSATNNLIFSKSVLSGISLVRSATEKIIISDDTKVYQVNISNPVDNSKQLTIENSFVQLLTIEIDKEYKIKVLDAQIYELTPANTLLPKESYINLSGTAVNVVNIESSYFQGAAVFNGLSPCNKISLFKLNRKGECIRDDKRRHEFESEQEYYSRFSLINSDLGKTQFIGCDLKSFDDFEFKNSKMLEVFMADTDLPNTNNIKYPGENASKEQHLEQQRLALSQFKKIYENRGDAVRATHALAEEMEVYRKQLRMTKGLKGKAWWDNRAERINLSLNRISSYYGNNWLRGAISTLIVNSVLFTIYCWCLGYRLGNDWNKFGLLAAYSLEFLNPLRKADFLQTKFGIEPNASAIFIDYFSRIVVAYFVYQTIAAFRKFGKRSS